MLPLLRRRALNDVIKIFRRHHAGHGGKIRRTRVSPRCKFRFEYFHIAVNFDVSRRTPPGPSHETIQAGSRLSEVVSRRRKQSFTLLLIGFRHERAFVLQPVNQQHGEDRPRRLFVREQLVALRHNVDVGQTCHRLRRGTKRVSVVQLAGSLVGQTKAALRQKGFDFDDGRFFFRSNDIATCFGTLEAVIPNGKPRQPALERWQGT